MKGLLVGALVALMGWMGAGGCASDPYHGLVSERDVPELAAALDATASHPNHTVLVPTRGPSGPEARVAIHQFENPQSERLLVFMHGVFSDSAAWRFMVGDLAKDHDLWLIDLPGCGESDKPTPEAVGEGGYSPAALAFRVLEALELELRSRGGEERITLVGHSLGGTVAIRMCADPQLRERFGPTLAQVDRMVVVSPVDVAINRMDPTFEEVANVSGATVGVGSAIGYVQKKVAEGTRNAVCSPDRALREEADTRLRVLMNEETRRPTQAMIRQVSTWNGRRPDWKANLAVTAMYAKVEVPTLIVWGERDEILPCSMGYKLAAQLPKATLVCIPEVMHSPEIEKPDVVAGLVREFTATGVAPETPHSADHGRANR